MRSYNLSCEHRLGAHSKYKCTNILAEQRTSLWDDSVRVSCFHYDDVIMDMIASQITSLTIVYSLVYSGTDQRKHQSSASLAFVRGIHRGPMNSPHKGPVTWKMLPFDDVIMLKCWNEPVAMTSFVSSLYYQLGCLKSALQALKIVFLLVYAAMNLPLA